MAEAYSVFDIFKIGIGPSSSHTVGPMVAAQRFLATAAAASLPRTGHLTVTLHGSLAFTGKGHGTDRAVILGLAGERPSTMDPDRVDEVLRQMADDGVESADTAGRYTVVGVAADARYQGFESAATEYFWTAFLQTPPAQAMVVVRAHGGVGSAITALREAVPAQQRGLALLPPSRLVDVRDFQFAFLRFTGRVLAAAGLFGLLLAAMGLYGTVAFAVTRRGRELAIRQAVGALPTQVVREVFSGGMKLALAGMVAGTAVVVPLIALLRAELEGVAPVEPIALVTGMVVVVAVTALASFLPARRATLVAPVETLRAD